MVTALCFCYVHTISVLYCAHLCIKCSLGISNFIEEISSLSHSIVFLYFFALITEEGFLSLLSILWISAFRWVYLSFSPYIYHLYLLLWQESLRRNAIAFIVSKRVWNAVVGCNLKNNRMISVHFQGKPFNITLIHIYALTSNAEEDEFEQFYEALQDLLELIPKMTSFSL